MRMVPLKARDVELVAWLEQLGQGDFQMVGPLAGDASFRRYFRIQYKDASFIVMDAPPALEPCESFVAIADAFRKAGVHTPEIFGADYKRGFLLIEDFGDKRYADVLTPDTAPELYSKAMESLLNIQRCVEIPNFALPNFDQALYQEELDWFRDWYLTQHLGLRLTANEVQLLKQVSQQLIADALSQPQVCVHRDYHSRNLMWTKNNVGVLDFQDAVLGPVTYDILSLLRDCYIDWPDEQVKQWVLQFYHRAGISDLPSSPDQDCFLRWFDWIGLQRNLKCVGIFARLHVRDQRPSYLAHIPRVLQYARLVCERYAEFKEFKQFLETRGIFS